MAYTRRTPRDLPLNADGTVNYQKIRRANRAREAGITKGPKRTFSPADAIICVWRNRVLGEQYPELAKEYGVSMETMRRRTREARDAGNITLVGRGELKELFPDGLDAEDA